MTLYKLNTDVIEIPDILIESEDLFDLKDLVAHKILVPITEQKCCDKCYSYTGGQVVYCVNLDCTCHKETLNPYNVKEEPVMTPKTNEQTVEEWERIGIEAGFHDHSIYVHCRSCHTWGVCMPMEKVCGNCGNEVDTTKYFPAEFVDRLLTRATAEAVDGERERIINIVKTTKEAFMVPITEKRFIEAISQEREA